MNIWLVGGEKVIPASVKTAIEGDGYKVERINGSDRYETAALIAEAGIKISGKKPSKVFVASGTSFADALAVSPVAFVKGYPIILTEKDSTSDFSKKELGNIGTDAKILVGGTAVVSDKVAADLSIKSDARVAGDDRAVTANKLSDWAKKSEGFNPANAALVGGTNGNGADSLVAAPLLGKSFTTLHFAGWDATSVYLKDHAAELTGKGFVFGGKAAVSEGQVTSAQSAAQSVASLAGYTLSTSKATVELDNASKGSVQYTVTGLGSDTVDIALFAPSSLTWTDGNPSFADANSDGLADRTAPTGASISVINGVSTSGTPGAVFSVTPNNGSVTFTVAATAATQAVPVVYSNAKATGSFNLKVDSKLASTVKYGFGAQAGFVPAEATFGNHAAVTVAAGGLNSAGKYVTSSTETYYYDSNDTFKYQGVAITQAQFESVLVGGGSVNVNYAASSTAASTYDIQSASVPSASTAKAVAGGSDGLDATVTWTAPAKASGIVYDVYRNTSGTLNTTTDVRVAKGISSTTYTDSGTTAGSYYYFVVVRNTVTGGTDAGVRSNQVTTPLAADVTAPTSLQTVVQDSGFGGLLDAGDVISVGASEGVKLSSNPGIVVTKGSDNVTLDSSNATFALDGQAIKVTVTKTPTFGTSATSLSLSSASITTTRGITDNAGNIMTAPGTITAAPTGAANDPAVAGTSATSFTVTFASAVDANTLVAADFTLPAGTTVASISWNAAATVATVTTSGTALPTSGTAHSITLKAKSVQDAAHTLVSPSVAVQSTI